MKGRITVSEVTNKKRLLILLFLFALILIGLIGRLGYIQIVWSEELLQLAQDQWTRETEVFPIRGMIKDRNGRILSQSANSTSIYAIPSRIRDAEKVATTLATILELNENEILQKVSERTSNKVWIKRQVDRVLVQRVDELEFAGIGFSEEPQRFYPNGTLASHLLGFTKRYAERNQGIIGQEGLELFYDEYLRGSPGRVVMETDLQGRELVGSETSVYPAVDGSDVVLTIDVMVQHLLEREISNAVAQFSPKRVYALAMNPNTGAILGMANYPTFDPNTPPRDSESFAQMQDYVRNFSIKDNVEPGSIFKILTAAAALETGAATLNSTYYCPGFKIVDGQRIRCWQRQGHGNQTFAEALINSCNPAYMEMALEIGLDEFYQFLDRFGLGRQTGIDLAGEASGIVIPQDRVQRVDLARISFGQAIAVTPLQLLNSVTAVINGGYLITPHLLKEINPRQSEDIVIEDFSNARSNYLTSRTRVISEQNSKKLRDILETTVLEGSGLNAYLPGFRVAGKTGTAQKYGPDGQILEDKSISSFIGFAPAENPEIIVLFMVDEPQVEFRFGSLIAAPHVGRILEDSLIYIGIEASPLEITETEKSEVVVPNLVGLTISEATAALDRVDLNFIMREKGPIISMQSPSPGTQLDTRGIVLLYLGDEVSPETRDAGVSDLIAVPDLTGSTVRDANSILALRGLKMEVEGNGVAQEQYPVAGSEVTPETIINVRFEMPGFQN